MSGLQKFLFTAGACALGSIGVFSTFLYMYQDNLLYMPNATNKNPNENPEGFRSPADRSLNFSDVFMKSQDGTSIHAWFIHPKVDLRDRDTILFLQGNAGNMGYRLDNLAAFHDVLGANVFALSYRGYGKSQGKPTESGLKQDVEAALDYIYNESGVDPTRVYIFGRSLGGAVAIYAGSTTSYPVRGIIVENTFTSIPNMVDALMPIAAYIKPLVLRINWSSIDSIKDIITPILFVVGTDDELIPPKMITELKENAIKSRFTELYKIRGGTHNDWFYVGGQDYLDSISRFLARTKL